MKVLLVAPQSKDTILGTIGCYCEDALVNLGYDVRVFDFRQSQYLKSGMGIFIKKNIKKIFSVSRYRLPFIVSRDSEKMNKLLLTTVEEFKPDIVFVLLGDTILPQTLEKIKKMRILTVNWFHDSVLHPIRKGFVQDISPYYDYFFIIDSQKVLKYLKIGSRYIKTTPLGCAPKIHRNMELSEEEKKYYENNISFVGTVKYGRADILCSLVEFDLGIWGYWTEKIPELRNCYRAQYIFGKEAVKIYNASKITLDIHEFYGGSNDIFNVTPRVFEVPASGAFLLTNENSYLSDLYEIDKEIVCYKDKNDLREKVRYFLAHESERKIIAQKGQQRAHCDHTYQNRFKEMFAFINNNS